MNNLKKYWWIALIILVTIFVVSVSLSPDSSFKDSVKSVLDFLESLSVIVVGILGLIWAYPWLKKKATESYVEKQVDIIFEANKHLRSECISLLEKYPVKMRSNDLTIEDVTNALEDVQKLYSDSIEANYDAYRYAYLLFNSVKIFNKAVGAKIPSDFHNHYYREDFNTFLHKHIDQILQYASTVDSVAKMEVDSTKKLVKRVDKYVVGNELMVLPGVDGKIRFRKADALLVLFFCNDLELPDGMHLLYESCFKVVPNGASFSRMMNNQEWYAPIQLKVGEFFVFDNMKLHLVGYKQKVSQKLESGKVEHYTLLYYSNISDIGFVSAYVKDKNSFDSFEDSYLGRSVLKGSDIDELWVEGERVGIKVKNEVLKNNYKLVEHQLHKQMRKDM